VITTIGVFAIIVGLIAWIGQMICFFAPALAVRLGLNEPHGELDVSLSIIENQAEGLTDTLLAWTLPAAALLMLLESPWWPALALVGGGIYLYFSTHIMLSRVYLKKHGKKVGSRVAEKAAYVFGCVWLFAGLSMITLAVAQIDG
jgi:hypothetical protein